MSKNASNPSPGLNSKTPKLSEGQLESLFRRLNLAHTRRIYQDVADRAEKENWSYRDFLALLLAEEVAHRKQTRLQRCTRQAHFPFFKTIDEFDFSLQTTLRQSLLGSYLGPDFVTEGRSLILYGKTGRGKTHLAVAIGYRAIQNGFETLCTTAAELVEELSNASRKGCLQESLLTYTHPHVLIVDEVGYLTYGPDAANVLFHVVNDRHLRKRPMIFTTNKPLSEWGKVLHDEDLATAILDRILERGRLIHLDGPSGRTRHLNLEEVLPAAAERARISGIKGVRISGTDKSERPLADLLQGLQFEGSNSPEVQRQEMRTWRSLPDVPSSIHPPRRAERFPTFVNETGSPLTLGAVGVSAGAMRGTEMGHVTPGSQPTFTAPYKAAFTQEESSTFFGKHLYPPLLKHDPRYYASTSDSFMGRASYAASRIFVTRDDSGKGRLNTSYFLRVLTSVAIHTAYRPYWTRSTSATFNDFGSTIGSDAGMNVFHEFGPGIRQMVKGLTPKFVSRIEERITNHQTPREVVSTPTR